MAYEHKDAFRLLIYRIKGGNLTITVWNASIAQAPQKLIINQRTYNFVRSIPHFSSTAMEVEENGLYIKMVHHWQDDKIVSSEYFLHRKTRKEPIKRYKIPKNACLTLVNQGVKKKPSTVSDVKSKKGDIKT